MKPNVERLSGAEIICRSLLRNGVEVLFGYPGGAVLPLYDALYRYDPSRRPHALRHVLVRHEQGAAHAAEGYARATGRTGVCLATSGPGATNLITGLAAAKMDSTPVVAVTGQVAKTAMGKEAFQECDTTNIARPVTKRAILVQRASDLAAAVDEAFDVARSGRPGPVLIDVPKDVQQETAEYVETAGRRSFDVNGSSDDLDGQEERLREAARLIDNAERPVIVAGHGVLLAEATDELRELAEKANTPVINTLHGLGSIPRTHRLSLGMLGMHGMYWANIAVSQADLVVGIGARFDDRVTGRAGSFAQGARVVHIEVDREQVGKNVRAHVPLVGDARAILRALIPLVQRGDRSGWLNHIEKLRAEHPSLAIPQGEGLQPQYVLSRLNAVLQKADDCVVVTGVGQHQMWAAQHLLLQRPNTFVTSGGLGVMGFEVPAAIGAQIGRPKATVWSVAGDGGFQMTMHELATVVQEGLPIKFALFNNSELGMVRQWQDMFYERKQKEVALSGPDFVKLAAAYGIPALRVEHAEDVDQALAVAQGTDSSFIIEFVVSPSENVYPMVPPGATLAETIEDPRQARMAQEVALPR